jgi:dTDP-4-dehydrorhamnose reductase
MTSVLILGSQGMLGSMLTRVLGELSEHEVTGTSRRLDRPLGAGIEMQPFDASKDQVGELLDRGPYDWVINAIGVTSAHIDPGASRSVENAIAVNALFPHRLVAECTLRGQRVIQIATDGVFTGIAGPYEEAAPHDATDVYGKTKSLGEVPDGSVVHLRCSIVGPEAPPAASLLGWVLNAPAGAQLRGYEQHRWNGVTTLQFAKLCAAVIGGAQVPALQHVVPADSVSKAELVELVLSAFGRGDVAVDRVPGPGAPVNRILATRDPAANSRLWQAAGYGRPPTIAEMLVELAEYEGSQPEVLP